MCWTHVTIEGYESLNMLDVYLYKPSLCLSFIFGFIVSRFYLHTCRLISCALSHNWGSLACSPKCLTCLLSSLRGWVSCGCGEHGISHEALGLASPSNPGCWVFSRRGDIWLLLLGSHSPSPRVGGDSSWLKHLSEFKWL